MTLFSIAYNEAFKSKEQYRVGAACCINGSNQIFKGFNYKIGSSSCHAEMSALNTLLCTTGLKSAVVHRSYLKGRT